MSPCSPYDRERPRDSVSTLGSMSALPAWAGDSATLGGTPGHERRAVPPKHAAKCPDCFTSEYLSYLVSSIPTMLWKKQTGCLHALWLEPVPRLLSLIFSDLIIVKEKILNYVCRHVGQECSPALLFGQLRGELGDQSFLSKEIKLRRVRI